MVTAVFAFLGTELVGVTAGEAQNPRKTIPRAIRLTFWRILIFYVVLVFLLGMIVPYNSKELIFANKATVSTAAASPFVVAIQLAGIPALPAILNACILVFVFSAANSDLYIASRTIYGLASQGQAPRILARTDSRGVPIYSLGLSALFCLLAYLNCSSDSKVRWAPDNHANIHVIYVLTLLSSKVVFGYFVNLVTIFGLLTWISLLVSHIYFVRARKAQNIPETSLAYKAPFGIWGSYIALFFCILIALTKNYSVFTPGTYGSFDYKNFITGYLGIPLYLIMIFGYKLVKKSKGIKPHEADLFTGKDVIDRQEEEYLAEKAAQSKNQVQRGRLYKLTLGWLF